MKIHFWSVGKPHEGYVRSGIEDFTTRIGHYYKAEWKLLPSPKAAATAPPDLLKEKEGDMICEQVPKDAYLILLDEQGKMMNSREAAALVESAANRSTKDLIFLIGGAFGVNAAVKQRANFTWSLSKLVFPHQLVRLILAEQIYRACTIINNGKYHHT